MVVAALRAMPDMDVETYRSLSLGNSAPAPKPAATIASHGDAHPSRAACDRCHDTADKTPVSPLTPRLAGQKRDYLLRALREYRNGVRQSGIMEPVAADLDTKQIEALASYYAALASPPLRSGQTIDAAAALAETGAALALTGDRARKIPACVSCHGADKRADTPVLDGQSYTFLRTQLDLWRRGGRAETPQGRQMADLAERLTAQDVRALSVYFASRSSGEGREP